MSYTLVAKQVCTMEGTELEEIDDQAVADAKHVSLGWMLWFRSPRPNEPYAMAAYDLSHELDTAQEFAATCNGTIRITIEVEGRPD